MSINRIIAGTGGAKLYFDVSPSNIELATIPQITLVKPNGTVIDKTATIGTQEIETDCENLLPNQYMFFTIVPTDFDADDEGDWTIYAQWDDNGFTTQHKITTSDKLEVIAP